ncbi:MAG: TIGR04100 family radical SAM protein [Clostridiales bacterium]|nr:TIGR04100 family radical SAM protein [Clostridiales bacterium]
MTKAMNIFYEYHNNLYVNLTNRCSSACTFCLRQTREEMDNSGSLWLEHEPSRDEAIDALEKFDVSKYNEIIFCGFGEPTERIDVLLEVAKYIKEKYNKPIRINTNGQGNLINKEDITPKLEGLIDTISISLNNPDPQKYQDIVRSQFGVAAFDAMIEFAREAKKYVPNVVMSTVDTTITHEEEAQCQKICDGIGVTYRIREWED